LEEARLREFSDKGGRRKGEKSGDQNFVHFRHEVQSENGKGEVRPPERSNRRDVNEERTGREESVERRVTHSQSQLPKKTPSHSKKGSGGGGRSRVARRRGEHGKALRLCPQYLWKETRKLGERAYDRWKGEIGRGGG